MSEVVRGIGTLSYAMMVGAVAVGLYGRAEIAEDVNRMVNSVFENIEIDASYQPKDNEAIIDLDANHLATNAVLVLGSGAAMAGGLSLLTCTSKSKIFTRTY